MSAGVWAIVVAAGSGERFGAEKQFLEVGGAPLYSWSVTTARNVSDRVVLVVPPAWVESLAGEAHAVVGGGPTRAASVRAGLEAVDPEAEVVVVQDAARPLASPALFRAVIEAVVRGADGAVPGVPIVDTVKRVRDAEVVETLDRSELVRVQTPQAFRSDRLRAAHSAGGDATDDAHLVEAFGGRVVVVPGEDSNIKVTTRADLGAVEQLLAAGTVTRS
jgi:2-C-methyl-D-erythritol 4-phosphate cytidylyltransferase